jgi:hypothetical protein
MRRLVAVFEGTATERCRCVKRGGRTEKCEGLVLLTALVCVAVPYNEAQLSPDGAFFFAPPPNSWELIDQAVDGARPKGDWPRLLVLANYWYFGSSAAVHRG